MELFKNIGETVNNAVDYVIEKNKKFNKTTKLKRLVKKESNNIIRNYITLGKHYYNELRDVPNYDMQKLCNDIDESKKEIKKLKEKLLELDCEGNLSSVEDIIEDSDEPVDVEVLVDEDVEEPEKVNEEEKLEE